MFIDAHSITETLIVIDVDVHWNMKVALEKAKLRDPVLDGPFRFAGNVWRDIAVLRIHMGQRRNDDV